MKQAKSIIAGVAIAVVVFLLIWFIKPDPAQRRGALNFVGILSVLFALAVSFWNKSRRFDQHFDDKPRTPGRDLLAPVIPAVITAGLVLLISSFFF